MWLTAAFMTLIAAGTLAGTALAETLGQEDRGSTSEADEWLDTAAMLNRPTMTDAAGSHGSYGIELGAGFSRLSTNPENRIVSEETGHDRDEDNASAINMPRLWISKGTMLPLDFTVTGGTTRDRSFSSAGGIVQVTAFEALALPAFSVRGFAGRTFGRMNTSLETHGAEAALSMGFLRYFRAYVTAGKARHHARMSIEPESSAWLLLQNNAKNGHYSRHWDETIHTAGLKLTILPGRLSLNAETDGFRTDRDAFRLRLTTNL